MNRARVLSLLATTLWIALPLPATVSAADPFALAEIWQASLDAESQGDYELALSEAETFQKKGGDRFIAALRAGRLYAKAGNKERAIQAYGAAAKLQSEAVNPLLAMMEMAQSQNDPKLVAQAANALVQRNPVHYQAQMALAGAYYDAKDYRKAVVGYRRVLKAYPDDLDAWSGAAWSSYYLGSHDAALAGFIRILSQSPNYPWAQQGYALYHPQTASR